MRHFISLTLIAAFVAVFAHIATAQVVVQGPPAMDGLISLTHTAPAKVNGRVQTTAAFRERDSAIRLVDWQLSLEYRTIVRYNGRRPVYGWRLATYQRR